MRRVLLYGNSLVVSTVGASLLECGGLELVRVDAGSAGAADTAAGLSALAPAAVIYDRVTTRPDLVIALLDQLPQALLIATEYLPAWSGPTFDRVRMELVAPGTSIPLNRHW